MNRMAQTAATRYARIVEDEQFAPVGIILILLAVVLLLLGAMILFFAMLARRGGPKRNFATAERQNLRSVIWTSEETWQASHRANAPWLLTAAIGLLASGVFAIGAIIVQGAAGAVETVFTAMCVALCWTLVFCIASGIHGRAAAKKILAQQADS